MSSDLPDYYSILSIPPSATQPQIREAYKRAALQSHPDRVPVDSPERPARTKKFQRINDAYYTLSDAGRRRDYDSARAFHTSSSSGGGFEVPGGFGNAGTGAGGGGFPWSTFGFGAKTQAQEEKDADAQFGDMFEEMLREEGMTEDDPTAPHAKPTGKFWSVIGGLSGAGLGFILANFPGLVAGAAAGNRLGAVRDSKGKSVYAVFSELPQAEKAKLLSELAARILGQALGSV